MAYEVRFSKEAFKDVKKLSPKLQKKLKDIKLNQIAKDPYSGKKLSGDLSGLFSVSLTIKDRIVYSIDEEHNVVYIVKGRTHYSD